MSEKNTILILQNIILLSCVTWTSLVDIFYFLNTECAFFLYFSLWKIDMLTNKECNGKLKANLFNVENHMSKYQVTHVIAQKYELLIHKKTIIYIWYILGVIIILSIFSRQYANKYL